MQTKNYFCSDLIVHLLLHNISLHILNPLHGLKKLQYFSIHRRLFASCVFKNVVTVGKICASS